MKAKDLITITSVAVATATLTCVTFWTGPLEAGGEATPPTRQITKPKLVAHGIEVTLAARNGRTFRAGDEPSFELAAVNTTGEGAEATIRIALSASSPKDMLSRVPRRASSFWESQQTIALKANETKVITIAVDKPLPADQMVSVTLQTVEDGKPAPATPGTVARNRLPTAVQALSFSTGPGQAQLSLVTR